MAEEDDSLEAEIVYPITCGESRANLIWRKFVCPGINVKCVQVRVQPAMPLGLPVCGRDSGRPASGAGGKSERLRPGADRDRPALLCLLP